MKSRLLTFIVLLFFSLAVKAQKEDYLWRLGYNGGINFNSGYADTFSLNKQILICGTNASICDSSGNFLFYSTGCNIYNLYGDTILNGSNLNPSNYTSSSYPALCIPDADIIIQRPDHPSQYYLFHETFDNDTSFTYGRLCNVLYLTEVDMTLDSGRGGVTNIKNYHLLDNDTLLYGNLSVVRHANGRDWWLVSKKLFAQVFYKWLIEPDTIIGPLIQSNQPASIGTESYLAGRQTCFSQQGDKYATIYDDKTVYLYDFDRCSGNMTYIFRTTLIDSSIGGAYGCSFSSTGRYLYVNTSNYLYQFDLLSGNISASETIVGVYDGYWSGGFQAYFNNEKLAPDNKIYIATLNGCVDLHVIENPDSGGTSCNFEQHSFHLPTTNCSSVPNIPNYRLGALEGSPCDTILNTVANLQKNNFGVNVYPNPVIDKLNIAVVGGEAAEIILYDVTSRKLMQENFTGSVSLNTENLAKGIYLYEVRNTNGAVKMGKVVKE